MMLNTSQCRLAGGLLALSCLLGGGAGSVWAQAISEQAIKAGFVFNFLKFTHWPAMRDSDARPLQICTPGAQALDGQLAQLQGRSVAGRAIEVRSNVVPGEWRSCGILYFTANDAERLEPALRVLGNAPVLTVGEPAGFVQAGGMIALRIEDNRIRFDVNLAAAQRAGLVLNGQMLQLAGQVLR